MASRDPGVRLLGRRGECAALEELAANVRAGRSAVLVLRGEAGIGKTALLDHLSEHALDCRVARAAGVEAEMELPYAGLHQLLGPFLDEIGHLPEPQRDALGVAFGLSRGEPPSRFLLDLAVLSQLAEVAAKRPLICLVDDVQWLDRASAQTLGFVARRLLAESVGLVLAVREPDEERVFEGLPELIVGGLDERDARALLGSVIPGKLDERIRSRILAETRGNPLALLELRRGLTAAELASGLARPDGQPLASKVERSFLRRVQSLPEETQRLLLVAAAEPVGDVTLLRRAAESLEIGADAASPALAAGLIELDTRVRFRHPLVRSAVYRTAALSDRNDVHRALAEVTDPDSDPDRRVWHRARATTGPDEAVAAELVRSADRAQARGGIAGAAAFLQRATELTPDPALRGTRALAAAQAKLHAGAFEPAATLLATAEAGPLDELGRARIDVLHAEIAFAQNRGSEALPLLLAAARRLEPFDVALARETYLDAVAAAIFADRLARGPGLPEAGEAARGAPPPRVPRVSDRLLDALAVRLTDGYSASAPMMQGALEALCDEEVPVQDGLRWLWLGSILAADLWDDERCHTVANRHLTITREAGALSELPRALDARAYVHLFTGELREAASLVEEITTVCAAIGSNQPPFGALGLAAFRGHEREARTLIDAAISAGAPRGQWLFVATAHWLRAVLCNGLGQYGEALAAAHEAARHQQEFAAPRWGLAELVEAATRAGEPEAATDAVERLSEATRASGTDWALGVEARSRALLSEGDAAEQLYRDAIQRLARTRVRVDLARAHLLYGEWLRRENRRGDARAQLGTAHQMLSQIGAEAFTERARRELQATGAKVRKRSGTTRTTRTALTAQEAQIARLAGQGLTNPEIGAQLFISHHTVEWHLRKVFSKLGIASRKEIRTMLPDGVATSA